MKKIMTAALIGLLASSSASFAASSKTNAPARQKATTVTSDSQGWSNMRTWRFHAPAKAHNKGKFVPS